GNLRFADQGEDWGFTQTSFSNGAAYGDLDNDGDLDLVINNENQPAFVYRNNAREVNKNHFIAFDLKGTAQNTFAIGSKVVVYADSQRLVRELVPSRGFQSSVDYRIVIGLGLRTKIDSFKITWPDLSNIVVRSPAVDSTYTFRQNIFNPPGNPASDSITAKPLPEGNALFSSVTNVFEKHQEDDYVDFYYERNIPQMLSRQGPKSAVADVNGDGLDDLFIGGAAGQGGQLYIQSAGGFVKKQQESFTRYAAFEDVAILFFDADGDKDNDLLICSGGNNQATQSTNLEHRLYINDGKGNFSLDTKAFPTNKMNIATIAAHDYDGDGDIDLFVGGGSVPGDYGATPVSYFFENDGKGHFTDVAKTRYPVLSTIGMTSKAIWSDLSGDGQKELVITGLWMAPRIFSFPNGKISEIKSNLNELSGWWQTVESADLDGDGDEDLVLGNIGQNFYLNPDKENPVKVWINDFDDNSVVDKVLTRTINKRDVPVFLKRDIQDQLPVLKKKSLKHSEFASKSIQDLFASNVLGKAVVKEFNYSPSIVAINNGNGQFTVKEMPSEIQLSSVNAVLLTDVNGDSKPDIVLGGNQFGFLPQFERLDANFGSVLVNNGKGDFSLMNNSRSGLNIRGEVRDISLFNTNKVKNLLFLRNNDQPVLYRLKSRSADDAK
ncbi:MAG: FG-GAP-like repeat-containing protein, partial [Flavitalea sp.]